MSVGTPGSIHSAGSSAGFTAIPRSQLRRAAARRLVGNLGSVLLSLVVAVVLWEAFLHVVKIPSYIARDPVQVYRYLFTAKLDKVHALRSAAGNRQVLLHELKTTLRDAGLGYLAGFVLAMVVACVFVMSRPLEQTFLPIALVLRSMPLIALVPVITLIFGRDLLAVSVIGGIVCFFPALVNVMLGLRSTPMPMLDLMGSYGASKLTTLRKVLVPSALPSIFASLRINVPAAMIGALLAEWLATGRGSGQEMLSTQNTFDYGELWAAVVLVTLVTLLAYTVVSAIEAGVLSRYAPDAVAKRI